MSRDIRCGDCGLVTTVDAPPGWCAACGAEFDIDDACISCGGSGHIEGKTCGRCQGSGYDPDFMEDYENGPIAIYAASDQTEPDD